MFRLNRITIHGFKDPNRVVDLNFADGPITVIYGENGSGKTTLLKLLHTILTLQSTKPLDQENVTKATIQFTYNTELFQISVFKGDNDKYNLQAEKLHSDANRFTKDIAKSIDEIRKNFTSSLSILFGINRGVVDANATLFEKINSDLIAVKSLQKRNTKFKESLPIIDELIKITKIQDNLTNEFISINKHLVIDDLRVSTIERSLINAYNKGQKSILKEMNNAFFATIDNAINIKDEVRLPKNFAIRFRQRKEFFLSFVESLDNSITKSKLTDFLHSGNQSIEEEGPVFKSLLNNLLLKTEQDERENLDLKAVNQIVSIFNQFVIHQKKLVINSTETYIQLPDDQRHELKDLSSGERHLLSFLTLFLILGRDRDIFLIDEPEISMSIKWQRMLLPLLAEFSPQAQIIVATHSPSIADGHTEYLKELV